MKTSEWPSIKDYDLITECEILRRIFEEKDLMFFNDCVGYLHNRGHYFSLNKIKKIIKILIKLNFIKKQGDYYLYIGD